MSAPKQLKATREAVRARRARDRRERARRLRGVPPEETIQATFELTRFTRALSEATKSRGPADPRS